MVVGERDILGVAAYAMWSQTTGGVGSLIPSDSVTDLDGSSDAGASTQYARGDHQHGFRAGAIGSINIEDNAVTKGKLSATGGISGQVLGTDGSNLVWQNPAQGPGGLTLPYNGSVSSTSSAFKVTNSGAGVGIEGAGGSNSGVYGTSSSSAGVLGSSDTGTGAQGVGGARGVYGFSNTGEGVYGLSAGSVGVLGASVNSIGVRGTNVLYNNKGELATAGEGVYGVSPSGDGVKGESSGSGTAGVRGVSSAGDGVRGESSGSNKSGVYGVNNQSDGYGVYGRNTGGGYGVYSNGNLRVDGDLYVTGACKGGIGPNSGAPFPRPAYDSGWVNIPGDTEMLMDTGLPPPTYSNDNFFIYLRGKVNNWEFVPFADLQAEIESDNKIEVYNSSSGACQFRLQVWYMK